MAPRVSQRLLHSLNLVLMQGEGSEVGSTHSARSDGSDDTTTSTLTCSTEGLHCTTP